MVKATSTYGVLLLLCLVAHCNFSHAATYIVGDDEGWGYNVSPWPLGKSFKAGDVLVFKYSIFEHNVVVVNEEGYDSCRVLPRDAKIYHSGSDSIPLVKGDNFFMSDYGDDCRNGIKLYVSAD